MVAEFAFAIKNRTGRFNLPFAKRWRIVARMRALITGSSGFVGRHLSTYLQRETDWQLYGVSRQALSDEPIETVVADLAQAGEVGDLLERLRPEVIFHLAGQASVAVSFQDPVQTLQNNLLAQVYLLEAIRAARLDPVVVVAGSNEIYGRVGPAELPTSEAAALRPASPYAVSKVAQDMLGLQYHLSYGLRVLRMRPFNHIGPGQDERFVVPGFAHQIALIEAGLQEPVIRVGNLQARRDFTDVRDIVRAYHLAATCGEPGEAYNLGSGRSLAIGELLELLLAQSSTPISVEVDPARVRPVDVPEMICDATRFRERTGWQPEIPIEQTLRDVLQERRAALGRSA
jgi:GDP-4-dehydro-6-deoxy-D-mannose reductase